ncbi:hypothetical protein Fmac_005979 [Flemingia macrophylla]|uniref:DCD domain-containing protein n=1 Tax=Flemingia macrophylla TaxID=520843 RepID=A0ABD1N9B6_9FABA
MGFNGKYNNADGKDPEFGAIFLSNSDTKRECFRQGIFGLPATEIQFVEQVKAGMILFLFEYEKRQLHGVFKATCDGGINIVPNAFAVVGKQCPAQVKFDLIWSCKPLPEKLFREAIRENYFSSNKFNFGLCENQVYRLLYLFSKRKLEPESPGRLMSRTEDLKSEWYSFDKVGRFVDHGMRVERVQNEQGVGGNISPNRMHKCQGDSLQYNGEVEYTGLNASYNKLGSAAKHAVDTTVAYASDYLESKDESRFTAYENGDSMDICIRPNIIGGYSKSPSDKIRMHGEGRLSISDRFMSKSLPETDQRIVYSSDVTGLYNSNVNPSSLYRKPTLEPNSLVQNQFRSTSTMIQPFQAQLLNNTCARQGDGNSKNTSLLYDPDVPGLNFKQISSVGINEGSKPIMERISPSNNFGRNFMASQPCLNNTELKDMSRWNSAGGDFRNSVFYSSNRDCMPLINTTSNSDQLGAESLVYEACNVSSLKSLSDPIPPPDIGNSSSLHEPFSSFFHNNQSWLNNNFHSTDFLENLSHGITLQKNNETFTPDISWANEGHSKDGDQLNPEYDVGYYGGFQNNSGYPKKKSSVFSRLSFRQGIKKQEKRNNTRNEEYDFHSSINDVMERVRQNHIKLINKRKPKPKHNKAESLRDKTQLSCSRKEGGCFEDTLTDKIMDLSTATGGNTNETAEDKCFVDFKRRSKVRKLSDENEIRISNESEKCENLVPVQQKRRKLVRPNFSRSIISDKSIYPGASKNLQEPSPLGSYNVKDVKESICTLAQTGDNIKANAEMENIVCQTYSHDKKGNHARGYGCSEGRERATDNALAADDKSECLDNKANAEVQNIICRTHSEDKNSSHHASGYFCGKGREKATDGALTAFNGESKCLENMNQIVSSCKDKNYHHNQGLCMMDSIKSVSLNIESTRSICQDHHVHNKIICAARATNADQEMPKDCSYSFTIEVENGSESLQNFDTEKASIASSCPIMEHVMDSIKSKSSGTDALHSVCQNHVTGKIICTGRGSNTKEEMSKDSGSFAGVKDGVDCLRNSNDENASIATSYFKEGLCMADNEKSVSPDSESFCSICQECYVDRVICTGRTNKNEEGMPEDGRPLFTTGVKNGSDGSQKSGNDYALITASEQEKA